MDRRTFIHGLTLGIVVAPALACAEASGSLQREEIEITVHKDPG